MPKIVRFYQTGGAEVLKLEDLPLAEPGKGEVRLRVEAIGLNRAEIMFRKGQYLEAPQLPSRLGYEAAGLIDAVGPDVTDFQIGDRVSTIPSFAMANMAFMGRAPSSQPMRLPIIPKNYQPLKVPLFGCNT